MESETRLKLVEEELVVRIDQLSGLLKMTILTNFIVTGAVPLTQSDVELIVRNIVTESSTQLLAAVSVIADSSRNSQVQQSQSVSIVNNARQTYASFTWGGRIHPVPEVYEFPR